MINIECKIGKYMRKKDGFRFVNFARSFVWMGMPISLKQIKFIVSDRYEVCFFIIMKWQQYDPNVHAFKY